MMETAGSPEKQGKKSPPNYRRHIPQRNKRQGHRQENTYHCVIHCFFGTPYHTRRFEDEMWTLFTKTLEYNVHLFYPE
jgi:hypothetical protein